MKYIKLMMITMAAVLIALPGFNSVYARGGGGGGSHGGGGGSHGSGGWNGGGRVGGGDQNHDRRNEHYNNDYHDGGWGWGAADGAIAGLAVGAAIDEASQPSTIIVDEQPADTVQQPASGSPAYGTQVTVLPPGSVSRNVNGTMAYECGSVWYRPYFGSSSVYYEVVPPPNQ